MTEISYRPVKWSDNWAKKNKILFIFVILYKSVHRVLGSGGSDTQEEAWVINIQKPSNIPSPFSLCLAEVDPVKRG